VAPPPAAPTRPERRDSCRAGRRTRARAGLAVVEEPTVSPAPVNSAAPRSAYPARKRQRSRPARSRSGKLPRGGRGPLQGDGIVGLRSRRGLSDDRLQGVGLDEPAAGRSRDAESWWHWEAYRRHPRQGSADSGATSINRTMTAYPGHQYQPGGTVGVEAPFLDERQRRMGGVQWQLEWSVCLIS
jgi:hypothetical protein